jgi:hypothetical protein
MIILRISHATDGNDSQVTWWYTEQTRLRVTIDQPWRVLKMECGTEIRLWFRNWIGLLCSEKSYQFTYHFVTLSPSMALLLLPCRWLSLNSVKFLTHICQARILLQAIITRAKSLTVVWPLGELSSCLITCITATWTESLNCLCWNVYQKSDRWIKIISVSSSRYVICLFYLLLLRFVVVFSYTGATSWNHDITTESSRNINCTLTTIIKRRFKMLKVIMELNNILLFSPCYYAFMIFNLLISFAATDFYMQ